MQLGTFRGRYHLPEIGGVLPLIFSFVTIDPMDAIIIPLGIITFILVLATLLMGLKTVNVKYHKLVAFLAISFAVLHGITVLIEFLSGK